MGGFRRQRLPARVFNWLLGKFSFRGSMNHEPNESLGNSLEWRRLH